MIRTSWLPVIFVALSYALLSAAPAAAQSPQTHEHSFGGAEKWAQVFDDPQRDAWQKPHEVIQALALKPGGRIAIIDFRLDSPIGPPESARIAPDRVKTELKSAGYALVQEHAFLPNQYFLIFLSLGATAL